ncbi:MAG: toll/interleukin-1 receptor domain-containing protein [Oceanicaulis sp.]
MARTVDIVHAPADADAAAALADALSARGRDAGALPAAEAAGETGSRCAVVLWSSAAAAAGESVFTAMIAALSRDALLMARLDRTPLPFGFRDFTAIPLAGLTGGAIGAGALRPLERRIDAMTGRPPFALSQAAASAVSSAKGAGLLVFAVSALVTAGLGAKAVDELGLPALGLDAGDRMDGLEQDFRATLERLDGLDSGAAAACEAALGEAREACETAQSGADQARAALERLRAAGAVAPDPAEAEAAYERAGARRAAAEAQAERFCAAETRREVDEAACAEAQRSSREGELRGLANARIYPGPSNFAIREVAAPRALTCPEVFQLNQQDWYDLVAQDGYEPMGEDRAVAAYRERFGALPGADNISALDRCAELGQAIMGERAAEERACAPQVVTGPRSPDECARAQAALESARQAEEAAEIALGEAYQTPAPDPAAIAEAGAAVERAETAERQACADEVIEGKTTPACQRRDREAARAQLVLAEAQSAAAALCREARRIETRDALRRCAAAREALSRRGYEVEASLTLRRADMAGGLAALRGVDVWGWLSDALPAPAKPYAAYVAIALSVLFGWVLNRVLSGLFRLFGGRTRGPKRALITRPASDVFISYSRRNADRVVSIADTIERLGLKVWIDATGIAAGEAWAGKIVQAVRESERFTLMGSKAAFQSDNVYRELHVAAYLKKPIKPFVLDGAEPPDAFLYFMAGSNFVDLRGRSGRALRETLEAAFARR